MRVLRSGGAGHCWSQGSSSPQMGANCHRAWPRSHSAGATQMPSQSMNATARPFLKDGVAGGDVSVADDVTLGDSLGALFEPSILGAKPLTLS